MRRISLLVGMVSLLCVGAMGAIVACGDDDSAGAIADPDAAAATSTSSSGAASSSSGAASSSSGAPTDGGASSSSSSSGDLPSNPGQFTCGAVVCDAGGGGPTGTGQGPNVCCESATAADTKCSRQQQCDNQGNNGHLRLQCDESADCDDKEICCYTREGNQNPSFTASCRSRNQCRTGFNPTNSKPRPQICKTSAECGDAGVCNPKTCDGFKLQVCGSPEGCQ